MIANCDPAQPAQTSANSRLQETLDILRDRLPSAQPPQVRPVRPPKRSPRRRILRRRNLPQPTPSPTALPPTSHRSQLVSPPPATLENLSKEKILSAIQTWVHDHAGLIPGARSFATSTGITPSRWRGKYWATWSDALRAAGLQPNSPTPATPRPILWRALAKLTTQLHRIPRDADLRLARRSDASFPCDSAFRRLGNWEQRAAQVLMYCEAHAEFTHLVPLWESALSAGVPRGGTFTLDAEDSVHSELHDLRQARAKHTDQILAGKEPWPPQPTTTPDPDLPIPHLSPPSGNSGNSGGAATSGGGLASAPSALSTVNYQLSTAPCLLSDLGTRLPPAPSAPCRELYVPLQISAISTFTPRPDDLTPVGCLQLWRDTKLRTYTLVLKEDLTELASGRQPSSSPGNKFVAQVITRHAAIAADTWRARRGARFGSRDWAPLTTREAAAWRTTTLDMVCQS